MFLDFVARELRIIELRVNGMKPGAIARREGVTRQAIYAVICRVYKKSGANNTAQLARWAIEAGLDVPAPPDTAETTPVPEVKRRKNEPIKLGRLRRSRKF